VNTIAPSSETTAPYNDGMNKDDHLQRHLELCRRMYLRMLADGTWPWKEEPDSTESAGMVESKDLIDDA